jgi:hypothetical protein
MFLFIPNKKIMFLFIPKTIMISIKGVQHNHIF